MDPFVAQLREVCRTHRTRAKWVFVPRHAFGHTVGERLAREGTSWANLRFTPPFDLALEIAAPFLVEQGIDPVADGLGPALIARLLLDLPASTPTYFRPLAEQPGMGDALWGTLRELRMAGVTAADLRSDVFEVPTKAAELAALLPLSTSKTRRPDFLDFALLVKVGLCRQLGATAIGSPRATSGEAKKCDGAGDGCRE